MGYQWGRMVKEWKSAVVSDMCVGMPRIATLLWILVVHLYIGISDCAAQVHDVGPEEPSFITEEDAQRLRDREDYRWEIASLTQLRFKQTSNPRLPSHLGGPLAMQLRSSLSSGAFQFLTLIEKDASEPWGQGSLPWRGPELKRASIQRSGTRFHWILGGFQLHHGFGLSSGSRRSLLPSAGSVLSLPDRLTRARPYAGSTGRPLRSGLLLGVRGARAGAWFWRSATTHTASIAKGDDTSNDVQIIDVSHTRSFSSSSSLMRRDRVRLASSGLSLFTSHRFVRLSLFAEHITATAPQEGVPVFELAPNIPRSYVTGSAALGVRLNRIETVTETSLAGLESPDWRLAVRWKSKSGSGVTIDRTKLSQRTRNPYGQSGKLTAPFNEAILRLGFLARFQTRRELIGRWARGHKEGNWERQTRAQWALDWIQQASTSGLQRREGPPRYVLGLRMSQHHQAGTDLDRSIRILGRLWFPISSRWMTDLQLQAGKRMREGRSGWTALLAYSFQRKFLHSPAEGPALMARGTYAATVLIRQNTELRTTLYASYPSVRGAFPALSGSSNLLSFGQHIRMASKSGTSGEVSLRADWRSSSSGPRIVGRITLQVRIPLGRATTPS